jgi:hypothetical protein
MSLAPRNLVLAAVAIALYALSAALDARHGFEPPAPLFADFDPARVARVRIARTLPPQIDASASAPAGHLGAGASAPAAQLDAGASAPAGRLGAPARQQQLVELERTSTGFGIVQCAGFPAHPGAVEDLLQRIGALRAGELLARNESGRGAYELGDNAPRLELLDASGRALVALRQGRDARGASVVLPLLGSAHDGEVVRAPGLIALDARPEAWLDARVPLPELETIESIRIRVRGESRTNVIEREAPSGAWRGLDARGAGALDLLLAALEGLVVVRVDGVHPDESPAGGKPLPPDVELALSGAGRTWTLDFLPLGAFETKELRVLACSGWERDYRAFTPAASAALVEQRLHALDEAVEAAKSNGGDSSPR